MELKLINTFLKVAEFSSFTLAADALGYSQAAVTMQIRQLEQELGTTLFDRFGKRTTLTEIGKQFIPYARRILNATLDAEAFVTGGKMLIGDLRIGSTASHCECLLPDLLLRFHEKYPLVKVQIQQSDYGHRLHEQLERNEIDLLLILEKKVTDPDLICAFESEERFVFVVNHDHSVVKIPSLTIKRLMEESFAVSLMGVTYMEELEQRLHEHGCVLEPFAECGVIHTLIQMACQGSCVSFLPRFAVRETLDKGLLTALEPVDFPTLTMHHQLLYHRDKWVSPQMKAFIELVRKTDL